jgi:competence protein ComEC
VAAAVLAVRSAVARRWLRRIGGRRRRRRAIGAAALAVATMAALFLIRGPAPPRPGELVVSFLDVGQGDATLLQAGGAAILVDTGPPGGPILRRLREAGLKRLDLLVLTHGQADHEGMAPAVLRAHPARVILNGAAGADTPVQRQLAQLAARAHARTVVAEAGETLRVGRMALRVLWPPHRAAGTAPAGDPNDRAVVAQVTTGGFDLLLPADAESNVTARLALPRVDALKVAHHGSADDGLPAELGRLRPRFAAIEVGADNTYGHPAPSTLAALRAVGDVARTDRDGTIRLRVAGGRMRVERERG